MTQEPFGVTPQLVESLARVGRRHRVARKLIIAPTLSAGRELLRCLARRGSGWIGFEVTTPRPLAVRLARPAMERSGQFTLDSFETQALLDEAMDATVAIEPAGFGALSDGTGFREKVHGAIEALRLAGVSSSDLERARLPVWAKRRFLHGMLDRYEQLLFDRRRVDTAGVVRLAVEALVAEGGQLPPWLNADRVLLMPGLGTRGLTGQLLGALGARKGKVLETEPVFGLVAPERVLWRPAKKPSERSFLHAPHEAATIAPQETSLFRAASVAEELREVLRRVLRRGIPWDQVEIVTPDPAAYGSVLHELSRKLDVPVTYAVGLPLERTRTGRVVRSYLDWIERGFQADPIRRLLEAGDLRPPRSRGRHSAAALARRFRSLRIGWGRMRYRTQIRDALAGVERLTPTRGESQERFARRRDRWRAELEALRSILYPTLRATPAVPDRVGEGGERVSTAEIARGLRAFLRRVPPGRGPDRAAREDVDRILERVEATLVRRTEFTSAVAALRRHLDIRVRVASSRMEGDEGSAPWSSEGGHLHLADLRHGGFTGRQAVFVVGMDADRLPGFDGQDPILLDSDRRILGEGLPTSLELSRERVFGFAALLARLRGSVTMSYCAWDASEGRTIGPSPLLLQALRLSRRDPGLTFSDLDQALGRVACAVTADRGVALDGDDTWMSELGRDGVMRTGVAVVCSAFPRLASGVTARRSLDGVPGPMHGVVQPRADEMDPRSNSSLVVSASRLEDLGTCPLRYLHASVLRIRPPDDPELDPERWLDPLHRGSLLHRVYERTLHEARAGALASEDPAFERLALEALSAGISSMQDEMPVPGEGALKRETFGLEQDVRSFVRMVREKGAAWVALELTFGLEGDDPVVIATPGGSVRLRGAVDRVDEDLAGVRVVDYKTGAVRDVAGVGVFNGGRRLQHGLYALAIEARLGGHVVAGEYHFPTMRGENRALVFDRLALEGVSELVDTMLDGVAAGAFVPTDRVDDCKFCDFADICRARDVGYGKTVSPLASWSEEHLNAGLWPAFAQLKRTRTFES